MKKLILSFLVFSSIFCFSKNDSIRQNYFAKRINLGLNYDIKNSNIGFTFSNSVDLKPLIHFEDFYSDFLYKVEFNTNFKENFNVNTYIGYEFPHRIFFKEIGVESRYYNYDNKLKFVNYGITGKKFINYLQTTLITKINYQELNNFKNIGIEIGAQKTIIYKKLYTEFGIGFNSNYLSYYATLQSLIYKDKFGVNLGFESINNYNFAKIGINYQIVKRGN